MSSGYTEDNTVVLPTAPPAEGEAPAPPVTPARFDAGKAARYAVANFGSAQVWTLFNTALPLYLDTYPILHSNPGLIGLLANERSFVGAFVQPVVGRISDRTRTRLGRRRPFFVLGIPLMCVALALLALHPPFWLMLAVMTIAAFFLSIAVDPYLALMADLFPVEQRGRVGGFTGLTNALGAVTLSLLAFMLWEKNEPWVFAAVVIILLVTWGYTFVAVKEPALPPLEARGGGQAGPRPVEYARELLTYSEASKYTVAMFLFWLGNGGATPYVTLFGKYALGAKESDTFLLPLMFILVTALFALPAGYLADRIGKKRVLTLGMLIFGAGALAGSQSPTLNVAIVALGVIGLGNACMSLLLAMMTDLVPHSRMAELVGLFSAVTSFAQPFGSWLAGLVVHGMSPVVGEAASYRWAFIFAGASILVGMFVLQTVRPERAVYNEQA